MQIGSICVQMWSICVQIGSICAQKPMRKNACPVRFRAFACKSGSICVQIGSICVQSCSICVQKWFHLRAKMVPWGAKPSHLRGCDLTQTWLDIANISRTSIKEDSKIFDAGCLQMHTLLALAVFISTYVADIKRFVDFEP